MNPLISVAIPTRNRPDLARMSVKHLLEQDYDNFEVIILDNSDDRELRPEEWADTRCRLIPTSDVLAMPANWERALNEAAGEYLIILSDKDMIVPGALARVGDVLRRLNSDMVSFRKAASFESVAESFIQSCTGKVIEVDFALVARDWFDGVQHMHDAPMLYNSAVRLELLRKISKRAGKFFVGSGPDVASSVLLAGAIAHYTLIDRPLVVSLYGPWSIGGATTKGRQGAAAKWLAEFGDDPLLQAGVIHGVTGVIAETLVACKTAHPDVFKSYTVAWPSYVRGALWELDARRRAGIDISVALKFLARPFNKPYSLHELLVGTARYCWEKAAIPFRLRRRWRTLASSCRRGAGVENITQAPISLEGNGSRDNEPQFAREAERYFRVFPSAGRLYRDVPYVHLSRQWKLADVIALTCAVNDMLDSVASDDLADARGRVPV